MKQPTIKLLLLLLVCMLTVGGMGAKKVTKKTTTKPKTNTSATKGVIAPQKQKKTPSPILFRSLPKQK